MSATLIHPDVAPAVQPQGCTNFKLRQLLRRVSQRYDAELAQAGLKTTQYSLLSQVLHRGPIRPGDLARFMTMDASTLTRNLKPLVAAGWLEVAAGEDGRSRLVHITDAGREKRAQAQSGWRRAQLQLNAQLGVERVLALHALIDEALPLLADDAPQENLQESGDLDA
ncbi:MarR family winged helix-turn-helix transcriptional regulator [Comamonas aquatilis]|uniref:MarR family winged helix-turn-helix transcriptional regulator n=1 Tax=Comamonas aquatilis TaxID=1778406 RepID=UPI0039F12902